VVQLPEVGRLAHAEDALILALWAQVQALTAQIQHLTHRLLSWKQGLEGR